MATATANPTSDEAVSGTWTGSVGTRYTLVDDHPDATGVDKLVHGTTAGNLTFGFTAFTIPAGSTSISVQVIYYDDKNASQACNVGGRLKVGGNYYNASTHNPTSGVFTLRTDSWANNPKTATAWTVDDVNGVGANALQAFGWVSTDASPSIDLTSVIVQVTYTPPVVSLASVSSGVATASGAVTMTRGLKGVATGLASVTGAIKLSLSLGGLAIGIGSVTGAVSIARALVGISTGISTVAGALGITRGIAGASTGLGVVSGSINITRGIGGSCNGITTLGGVLTVVSGEVVIRRTRMHKW